ncbi:MAG: hypothetical protein WAU53_07860 [Rhodoplanes sp.]|jgi:hypothetical protein
MVVKLCVGCSAGGLELMDMDVDQARVLPPKKLASSFHPLLTAEDLLPISAKPLSIGSDVRMPMDVTRDAYNRSIS